jgi:hypothetical protein
MKKTALNGAALVVAIALCLGVAYAQPPPSGSSPQGDPTQQGGWYCPYAGGMMGPMHGGGWGSGQQAYTAHYLAKDQANVLLESNADPALFSY